MAIVATYKYPNGTVYIDDSYYRDVPEEEMQARIKRLQQVAWEIWAENERRKANEKL